MPDTKASQGGIEYLVNPGGQVQPGTVNWRKSHAEMPAPLVWRPSLCRRGGRTHGKAPMPCGDSDNMRQTGGVG